MNEYLTAMTDIIQEESGTLDKYIGDAIVAMFGAPIDLADHANRACVSAVRIQERQAELCRKWAQEETRWPDAISHMHTRVGLNSGIATVGNMGSRTRFSYTMMGDTVNLAARCESGASTFGIYTMVTGETRDAARKHGTDCVFRHLDRIVVKGRTRPVTVYELLGLEDHMSTRTLECLDLYARAVDRYLKQNWDDAISLLKRSVPLEANQPSESARVTTNPSLVFLDRCRQLKLEPPGDRWEGVFVMQTK